MRGLPQQTLAVPRDELRVLARPDVKVEARETEKGIVVEVTSNAPVVAKETGEKLSEYFRNQPQVARRLAGAGAEGWMVIGPGSWLVRDLVP